LNPCKPIRYLTVSIAVAADKVYDFVGDPLNLPRWAAGLGQGVRPVGEHWEVVTGDGTVGLRFAPRNSFGVADHTVTLADGSEVYVPLRVMPNGDGSEVMMGLFRQPEMDDAAFERDAGLMQADLQALKTLLEKA